MMRRNDEISENRRIESRFLNFLNNYQEMPNAEYYYRKQVRNNYRKGKYFINVDLNKLGTKDNRLLQDFVKNPSRYLPIFERAARKIVEMVKPDPKEGDEQRKLPPCQLLFSWVGKAATSLRDLQSKSVSTVVCISGIITKASRTTHRLLSGSMRCPSIKCQHEKKFQLRPGQALLFPKCPNEQNDDNEKCTQTLVMDVDSCFYRDEQSLKLQELHEDVPTGEIPRSLFIHLERYMVEHAPPGSRVKVVGIFSTDTKEPVKMGSSKSKVIKNAFVRVLGLETVNFSDTFGYQIFDDFEEQEFKQFSKRDDVYDYISQNIDPAIFGHMNIKRAIACLLFGGTTRKFKDGTRRRGDMNVLLLGDPSTAKSQLLKFATKIAPVAIYTSGKGSSAAGLTASVVREPSTREFYLEGGSMVLADGGVCCIDEFDKMNERDRVAIHEAMEQQTISIAKAGITTVLNSRTSVLAAANPIGGKYEEFKDAEEQIDFQTTILSRFDLIFIVRDVLNKKRDRRIARHVTDLNVSFHRGKHQGDQGEETKLKFLKNYITYCKRTCHPVLNDEAIEFLTDFFVEERSKRKTQEKLVIPITVRQLEALIRITEALAKMRLLKEANREHAEEAVRLFKRSTLDAIKSGELGEAMMQTKELETVENLIRDRVSVRGVVRKEWLISLLDKKERIPRNKTERALYSLTRKGEFSYRNKRRSVYRKK